MRTPAALAPLREPVFRGLWLASFAANLTMWMNDVAAAWLMTSLTTSPVLVALVQTASTLPVFLLGLPSGALADIIDRRRYFAVTQLWVSLTALALAGLTLAQAITAPVLLVLTFLNGVGLAMRWPVFAAIVPSVVPRAELPAALALNGISMNLSRVVGPMLAGSMIAAISPTAVFVVNVVLAVMSFVLILRWRSEPRSSALPGERFVGAMRVGLNYAWQSPRLKVILLRVFLFFLQTSSLVSLLPLVARGLHGGGPGTFTFMLASLGLGAITAAFFFPRWRVRYNRDQFVAYGTVIHAVLSAIIVGVPEIWVALPTIFLLGMAWISVANSLAVAAQTAMPDWVRARGMATYQMALMGGAAAGSLVWGQVAGFTDVRTAVWAAAAYGVVVWVASRKLSVEGSAEIDFTPVTGPEQPEPAIAIDPQEGPVMVTIEYRIDPAESVAFVEVMDRTRRARLRQGALSWGLFKDTSQPGRYVEYFVDENWLEHQRRLERFTAFDAELRQERLKFHQGSRAPVLRRYVAESGADLPPAL